MTNNSGLRCLYGVIDTRQSAVSERLLQFLRLCPPCLVFYLERKRTQESLLESLGAYYLLSCLAAHMRLDSILDQIRYSSTKRPLLDGVPHLDFSISHSHGMAVCVLVTQGSVGIDLEFVPAEIPDVGMTEYLSASELAFVKDSPDSARRFFNLWTQKEAVMKAQGDGFLAGGIPTGFYRDECDYLGQNYKLYELEIDSRFICNLASDRRLQPEKVEFKQD